MNSIIKNLTNGFIAGILISIGGTVYLLCDIKPVGATLFGVALLCICYFGYSLFTGKICYMVDKYDKEAWSVLLWGLLGNLIGTFLGGLALRYTLPAMGSAALTLCHGKLENQVFLQTLIRGIFCGLLIYFAVEAYKVKSSIAGIIFCIPVFILSGYEHSIADMFYFAASGIVSLKAFTFIWIVILGNTIGGMLIPFLKKVAKL